ncbi:Aliphatic amidase expression-regulating protein [Stieleria maiorica]|uniref:non-specific serine/threonine protein kinase n=1 Tax=Stieleria maiorica TaxID=2795974 RepID=A0A5B9MSY7_9BACT|nr:transporter substrate-binding protein [Stieleria maiorica]QEG02148.1 Aliphatic amidase expression-regulating protein [Stieleria maiorica]
MSPDNKPSADSPEPGDDVTRAPFGETESLAATPGDTAEFEFAPVSLPAENWIGKSLGKYEITGVLGQGGMGVVLQAHDPTLERDVAIKILTGNLAANATALHRFQSEAKAAGKLSHAHVAAIYEIGQEGPSHFLAMELLTGGSVAAELQTCGAYTALEATRILIDACRGIAAAHAEDLVHRDIKPANLVRAADGAVKLTDFGLAKFSSAGGAMQLTQSGTIVGTPYFMSPEQCQAQAVDARTDIYSLGATYFCLLTGRQPYDDSDSVVQVMYAHCNKSIPDPREVSPSVPPACSAIVSRAMAKDPDDRYQSAEAMLRDLEAVAAALSGEARIDLPSQSGATLPPIVVPKPSQSRRWMIGGIVGSVLVLGLLLWSFRPSVPTPTTPQGEPIKVGVLQSLSGTMSASGNSVIDATLLAIEEINQSGGLLGRPVKAVVADGRSDTQVYAREAERLITEEQVCTVFGCWTSASRKTVRPIIEKHDHLLVYPLQYEGMEESPNIVYLGAAPNQQIIPAVTWAVENLNRKRFFLIGSDYVFPRTASEVIKDQLSEMDAEVVGEMYVPLGSSEFAPVVQAILQTKPDLILNSLNGDSNVAFFRAIRAADINRDDTPCLSFSIGEQELRGLEIASVDGDYLASTYFQSLDTPANEAFLARFKAVHPHRVVSDPMENAYAGVHLWAQAVREAESIEPKTIRRAMLGQQFAAPEGQVRIDPETQHCFQIPRIGQIQGDGQIRIVWSADQAVRPEPYPPSRTAEDWKAFLHDLYVGWGNEWESRLAE